MKKTFFKLIVLLLPTLSMAQMSEFQVRQMVNSASERELVIECSRMLQENYYFHAEIVVDKLLTFNSTSANYNYRKGFIILEARQDTEAAIRHFSIAITDTDKNYDMYSHKEESAAVDAFFHLGKCYHLTQQLDKAQEQYKAFILHSNKKSERVVEAQLMIEQCDIARGLIRSPKSVIVKNIGDRVNTDVAEYAPVISLDGNSLYFTSRRQWEDESSDEFKDPKFNNYPEDIYVSYKDMDGDWTSPEKLDFCNNQFNEATIAVSSDERKIYVYKDITGAGDIYYSNFGGNKFDSLLMLDYDDVNTEFWETHCTVTPDGQNMYFVSNRPGGYGGRDIYRVVKLPNGEWSRAQNMGPTINTPFDEESPFIDINNKTLYFASNGPLSMGGFDIFVTFRDEENTWTDPVNLGYPINSCGDDLFYTTTIDGLRGYLTSFRSDGYGEKDIYEIQNDYLGNSPISSLRGSFISLNENPVPANMKVVLQCPACDVRSSASQELRIKNDQFFAVLERCKDYIMEYYDEAGTLVGTENFVTRCNAENEELKLTEYLGKYTLVIDVADAVSKEFIEGANIELIDPTSKEVIASYVTGPDGTILSDYYADKEFGDKISLRMHIAKEGYLTQTFAMETELADKARHVFSGTLLQPAEAGTDIGLVYDLNPIYFDLSKWNIRDDAALELDKIVEIMNENPTMKIELESHTDCRSSKAFNMSLSSKRAKSSAAYIKEKITNPSRIYGKGYGESQLVNDCGCEGSVVSDCSEEEHQANRRTEFTIIE
ncbi:MAG: outer membrane protein OmpA-like peptidoglycan-associated protein [Crocinitomicaceae bacterium]|jgi:outer membrane protein OmpA-like peptidoglycan-associated protein